MSSEDVVQNQIEVGGEEVPGEFVEAEGGGEEGDDEFGEDEGGDDEFGEDDRGGGEFGEDEGGDDDLGEDGGGGDDLGEDEGRGDDLGEDEGGDDDLGEDEGGYDDLGEDEGGDDDLGEDEGGDDDLGEDEGGGDELGEGEESGDEFEEDERGSANIAEGGGGDVLSDEGGSEEEAGVALQLRGSGKSWRQAEGESSGEELRSPLEVVGDQDRLEPKGERATGLGSAVRFAAASWHIDEDVSRRTIRGDYQLSEIFLRCMCFKYPDMKRKDLVLRGDELYKRIGRRINDVDIETICEFVKTHPEVVGLDLSYNRITENGASYLFYFLTGNKCLESLNLMDNNIRNVDVLQEMGADLHLKTLRLKGNELEKKGGMAIARLVEETMTLEVVDVGQTEQDVYSLVHLTNALAFNRTLTVVDLSGLLSQLYYQAHTDHFARLIGNMLKFNTTLVELHLEKNGLTDHDLEVMLWHGMEVNKTLQLIDLSANHIGDQGADILASYLDHTRQLKGIMLRSNMIRDTGARSLSFKLPFSKVILLDLSHNRIGDQGMVDLLLTLKKPFPLLAFFFFGNLFKERVIKLVHKLILAGELWNDAVDVIVYEVDGVYSCALNGFADQYRRRYYCLPSTTWPQVYKLRRYPPVLEHSLDFKYHNPIPKRVPVSRIEHSGRPPTEPSFRKTCSL